MGDQRNLPREETKYPQSGHADRGSKPLPAKRGVAIVVICCVFSLAFISAGILLGVWFGGIVPQTHIEPLEITSVIEGAVVFSGGVDYGGTDRVNPLNAVPVLDGVAEDTNMIRWWIVEIDSESILHEGEEGGPEFAFALLREHCRFGEYTLYFRLEETGSKKTHLVGGNFFIKDI